MEMTIMELKDFIKNMPENMLVSVEFSDEDAEEKDE